MKFIIRGHGDSAPTSGAEESARGSNQGGIQVPVYRSCCRLNKVEDTIHCIIWKLHVPVRIRDLGVRPIKNVFKIQEKPDDIWHL